MNKFKIFFLMASAVLMLFVWGSSVSAADNSTATDKVVGAIRWDAWTGDNPNATDDVGEEVEESLGPEKYHFRLPFYAEIVGTNEVDIDGDTQTIVDQEITYAKDAGLDYWAFVTYPTGSLLNSAFDLYQSSSDKDNINFSVVIEGNHLLKNGATEQDEIDRYVGYFGQTNYQTVLNGRPLVYLFSPDGAMDRFGSWSSAADFFQDMEDESVLQGYGEPYFVVMGNSTQKSNLGFDAVSDYAYFNGSTSGKSYETFNNENETDWENRKTAEIIPLVSTGWDKRPRCDNPVSWESTCVNDYVEQPLPEEIAVHMQEALDFVENNPTYSPADAVLVYAWNEFDEGGWIAPTLFDGSARLDALATPLKGVPYITSFEESNGEVTLNWTAPVGADSYTIKRSTTSGGSFTAIDTGVTATSYTDSGLTNGTTYYYIVTAVDNSVESGASNEIAATPIATDIVGDKISEWDFDNSADDAIGSNDGTLNGGAGYTDGILNNAVQLDGTDDYVAVADSFTLEGMNELTVAGWVRLDTLPTAGNHYIPFGKEGLYRFIIKDDGKGHFVVATTNNAWYSTGTIASFSSVTIGTNSWVHLTGTYDGSDVKVYVNGVEAGSGASSISGNIETNSNEFRIGHNNGNSDIEFFDGLVDKVIIYDRALNSEEIDLLYDSQTVDINSDKISEWNLDNSALDAVGNNDATLQNGAAYTTGKQNNGVGLDGTDDFVNIADDPTLEGMSELTVSAWINMDNLPPSNHFYIPFGKENVYRLVISPSGSGTFVVATDNHTWYSSGTRADTTSGKVGTGGWYHLVGTYDGSDVKIYVNGVLEGTGTASISGDIVSNGNDLRFGHDFGLGNMDTLDGVVDEVIIYDRALDSFEVQALFDHY